MRLSIVIPTIGRSTLSRTLDSLVQTGLKPNDEILVIGDGGQPEAERICKVSQEAGLPVVYRECGPTNCYGNAQREFGQKLATGDAIVYIDDDDEYLNNALSVMREHADEKPENIQIFKFQHRTLGVIWKEQAIRMGNVSTQMVLVPNHQERLGKWPNVYEGDYWFIRRTVDNWPYADRGILWRDEVVAVQH
jgi:glycosyltransferase involved in cell wall biosynthesis